MDLLELRAICLDLHVSDGKWFVERGYVRHLKKDVKNEGRTDYVHENKGPYDKVSATKPTYLQTLARHFTWNSRNFAEIDGSYAIFSTTEPLGQ